MRLTHGAFNFLRKKYAAILLRCPRINLLMGAAVLLALPANAAILSISAPNGSAVLDSGGVYEQLNIAGSPNPTLDITKRFTITGPGSNQPIITSATSAHLRVIDTTLSLGSATNTAGGILRGDIYLDKGTLQIYSNSKPSAPASFYLGSAGDSNGEITGNGSLLARRDALLFSGKIGSQEQPLPSIQLDKQSHIQIRDGLFADSVIINEACLAVVNGDININDLNLNGSGSSIQADYGDIYLKNLTSTSPDDELLAQTGINADEGNITISGELNLVKGLTAIRAGKDITIANGEGSIKGPGKLYLRAKGHVRAGSTVMADSDLEALRMSISGDLVARNALAAQLTAQNINIGENLEIQGNSVNIFGVKVDYGILDVKGEGNRIGGDLRVFDAKLSIPELAVGKDAILSAISGEFTSLAIGNGLDFAAGDLTGESLTAKSIVMGESEFATKLNVKRVGFESLQIGSLGTLSTDAIAAPGGSILLENGGALHLSEGDLGSAESPLKSITLGRDSSLEAPGAIYADSLTGTGVNGNPLSANADIMISGPISGSLELTTPAEIHARAITANSLNAKDVTVSAGSLTLHGASEIANNLVIYGAGESSTPYARAAEVAESGTFTNLRVGNTLELAGSSLSGQNLTVGTALVGATNQASTLYVENVSPGFGLGVGQNGWVTLGPSSPDWLKSTIGTSTVAPSDRGALGVYTPVTVGSTGVELNPARPRPTPQSGQLNFAPESLLVVYGPNAREDVNPQGIISASTPMQANVQEGARLLLDSVVANQVYGVLGENITTNYAGTGAWDESRLETGSHIIGIRKIEGRNGWFATQAKAPEESYPGIDPGIKPPLQEGAGGTDKPSSVPSTPVTPAQPTTPSQPDQPGTTTPGTTTPGTTTPGTTTPGTTTPGTTTPGTTTPGTTTPGTTTPGTTTPGTTTPGTTTPGTTTPGTTTPGTTTPGTTTPGTTTPGTTTPGTTTPGTTTPGTSTPGTTTPGTSTPGTSTPGTTTPDNPGQTPAEPANPDDPAEPDIPQVPENPEDPDQPGAPATPSYPEPDAPAVSEPALGTEDKHFNSDYAGIRFLSRVTSTKYMDHHYDLAWKTIESAARMAILAGVPQLTYSANMGAVEASESRSTFADRIDTLAQELNGNAFALWITPIYRNLQGYGLEAFNLDYDLSGGLGGVVLGGDLTFGKNLRFGIDASIGGGYAKSGGDMATTTNEMGFVGIGAYAGWLPGNFGLAADIHFTSTWNSIKQDFPVQLEMRDPTGELTARALSMGLRAEYRIPFDEWLLIPHAGARYANVHTDNYSIYSNGAMIDGQDIDQNIWTFPFGLELRGNFTTDSGWLLQPSLDALATPATGDIYANTKLHFTGVPGEANIDTQTMDYWRYGGRIGFQATKDCFSIGINYQIQAGSHTTEQNVFGTLIYEF